MNLPLVVMLLGAASQSVMAGLVLWRSPRHPAHLAFSLGMLAFMAETLLGLMAGAERTGPWRVACFAATAMVPAPWLVFSLSYGRGGYGKKLRRLWPLLVFAILVPPGIALGFDERLTVAIAPEAGGVQGHIQLGPSGIGLGIFGVVAQILVLANLERTFRDSVGLMRWRIKYMILGLAVLFSFRLYAGSQAILYSSLNPAMLPATGAVGLLAAALISVSLNREAIFAVDVYPSNALLFQSATVLAAGAYLIIVGLLAQIVRDFGGEGALPVQAFFIMLALAILAVGLLSERWRRRVKLFFSRHLRRPVFDYRQVWTTFTRHTATRTDEASFCNSVSSWLAETFQVLSVSVWPIDDDRKSFRRESSTATPQSEAAAPRDWEALITALAPRSGPIDLDAVQEPWALLLKEMTPGFFPDGGQRICLPLKSGGELVGLILVADRVGGAPFSPEDLDLLRCVGDQTAAGLHNLGLSRQILSAKELEAFQTMSAFFVHDLKNTASTLSLTLQNLHEHFGNPAFRDDALRAVGKSVQHLETLIGRLGQIRQGVSIQPVSANLSQLTEQVLRTACLPPAIRVHTDLRPDCPARFDGDQLGKVVLNLVLNARDAVEPAGEVRIATASTPGWAELSVADNGCGMAPEFVSKCLFRPFQTTKKRGIGIGMFQSKLIIDAHGGRVQVESRPGQGTTFRVYIPTGSPPP